MHGSTIKIRLLLDLLIKFETCEDIVPKEMSTSIVPILGFRAAEKL
jgi:hypothetical protein